MDINDDNFFDDMQNDIQENNNGINNAYQDDKKKKNKLILTVAVVFASALLLLGLLVFFLSDDKTDDMVSIRSLQQNVSQDQSNRNVDMHNGELPSNNDGYNQHAVVTSPPRPVSVVKPIENKVLVKKIAKRAPVKKKKDVVSVAKPVELSKKTIPDMKPVLKGLWKIQLMSAQDRDNDPAKLKSRMNEVWMRLVSENSILNGYTYDIEQTNIKGVTWYRLRVVGLKNSQEATNLCLNLKNNNVACVIVK